MVSRTLCQNPPPPLSHTLRRRPNSSYYVGLSRTSVNLMYFISAADWCSLKTNLSFIWVASATETCRCVAHLPKIVTAHGGTMNPTETRGAMTGLTSCINLIWLRMEILRKMLTTGQETAPWIWVRFWFPEKLWPFDLDERLITKQHTMFCNLVLLLSIYSI